MPRLLALAFVLAACGGGDTKPAIDPANVAKPAADPAPCEDAATNAVKFLDKAIPADKVKQAMVNHCAADKWTVEVRKCLLTAKSIEELDPCGKQLTRDQDAAFKKDIEGLDSNVTPPAPAPQNTPPSNVPPAAGSK